MEMNMFSLPAVPLPNGFSLNLAVECQYPVNFYQTFLFSVTLPVACVAIFLVLGTGGWLAYKGRAGVGGRSVFTLKQVRLHPQAGGGPSGQLVGAARLAFSV